MDWIPTRAELDAMDAKQASRLQESERQVTHRRLNGQLRLMAWCATGDERARRLQEIEEGQ